MNLKSEMAKLRARKARIEKQLARVGEYPGHNRAYLSRRTASLAARYYVLESRIDEAWAKAGTT